MPYVIQADIRNKVMHNIRSAAFQAPPILDKPGRLRIRELTLYTCSRALVGLRQMSGECSLIGDLQ
jgi:hypothetical protein